MRKIGIFFVFGVLLIPNFSSAVGGISTCSKSGYTIATVNGVFTDQKGAETNLRALRDILGDSFNNEVVDYQYLLNPSHIAGFGDALKAFKQKVEDGVTTDDYDLIEMIKDASGKVATQKLLLVAHSQGNFYANSFYDKVVGKDGGVPVESMGMYSIATPSDHVSGNGRYFTSGSDKVISGVVGSMPFYKIMSPNTFIELGPGDDQLGHSFSDVYLKHKGAEIVKDIEWSLDKLQTNNVQLETSPCIDAPKVSIFHKAAGVAFAVADPVANGTRVAFESTVKGVYTIGLAVGNASKFVADALIPGKQASLAGAAVLAVNQGTEGQEDTPPQSSPLKSGGGETTTTPNPSLERRGGEENPPAPKTVSPPLKKEESTAPIPSATVTPSENEPKISTPEPVPAPAPTVPAPANTVQPTTVPAAPATPPSQTSVPQTVNTTIQRRTSGRGTDTTPPDAPVITSPGSTTLLNTTNVTFVGTAEEDSTISTDFSASTSLVQGGAWSLNLTLPEGATTVRFYATDAAGNVSSPASATVSVDSLPPSASLASATCAGTLSSAACLVATTTLAFSWSSVSSDVAYFNLDKNGTFSTTTATSTSVVGNDASTYTFKVAAVDSSGNTSATSTKEVEVFLNPIVINEIAWAGTSASSFDEFIELYNRTDYPISLANWKLYAQDLSPYLSLSGTIGAGSYFLIERSDDDTVGGVAADLVMAFSGVGGSGLSNTGESLILAFAPSGSGQATTTIDTVATCSGGATTWCAGNSSTFNTMERYDAATSGSLSSNWYTNDGEIAHSGQDANGGTMLGTPRARNSASYSITAGGATLTSNKTLSTAHSPYVVGRSGFTVGSGATLTIPAGVVIKFLSANNPAFTVAGTVVANGTEAEPVVFTALADDTYGGDTNGDGSATAPVAGSWRRLFFDTTSTGSSLTHTLVRYGGNNTQSDSTARKGALGVDSASVTLDHVTVEYSNFYGLALENSNSTVTDGTFSNNSNASAVGSGIYVSGGSPTISNNILSSNYIGISLNSAPDATVSDNTISSSTSFALYGALSSRISGNSGAGSGTSALVIDGASTPAGVTRLQANSLPYLIKNTLTVGSGSTLAFATGTVIKGWDSVGNAYGHIQVESGGAVSVNGSSPTDVVFTSMYDDTVGGTTVVGTPAPANWKGITVDAGGTVSLSGFTMKYAGAAAAAPGDSQSKGAVKITGSSGHNSGTISHALFDSNYQSGLNLADVFGLTVSDVAFQNHTQHNAGNASGIYAANSTTTLSNITWSGNEYDARGTGTNALTCTNCGSPNASPSNLFSQ